MSFEIIKEFCFVINYVGWMTYKNVYMFIRWYIHLSTRRSVCMVYSIIIVLYYLGLSILVVGA